MARRRESLSELIRKLPSYYTIRQNFRRGRDWDSLKRDLISLGEKRGMEIDLIDGVRLSDLDVWALVRPSKTEPKIRVLVEGEDRVRAEELLEEIKKVLQV